MLTIPQCSPRANYLVHKEEIDQAIAGVLDGGYYILGNEVRAFEEEFAAFIGVRYAVGVANGTDALQLALRAAGVGAGDLVITVSHTAVATVAAIELAGAKPIFVDIDPESFTLDPNKLEDVIKNLRPGGLKAIVPVHIYGQPANMTAILEFANAHGLMLIEDCAQAHGAEFQGRKVGSFGSLGSFSFYPTKNLSAIGDGGMVVTDDADLAERARLFRQYGWQERYVSYYPGTNSRLDEIQAAILRIKLKYLDQDNRRRSSIAAKYSDALVGAGLCLPRASPNATHVYHQYVVRTDRRDHLKDYLGKNGIGALVHYPVPVHQQPAYVQKFPASLEQTERIAPQILSLPMYPELTDAQVLEVCQQISAWSSS